MSSYSSARSRSPRSRSHSRSHSRSYYSPKSPASLPLGYRTIGTLASYLNAPSYKSLAQTTRKTKHYLNRMTKPLPGLLQYRKRQLRPVTPTLRRSHRKRTNASFKNMLSSNLGTYNRLNSSRRKNFFHR